MRMRHSAAALVAATLLVLAARTVAQTPDMLHHIHGLAFSADGRELIVPSHFGLAVYAGGKWSKAAGPAHDYMGFAATRGAIYASGHPAPGSGLVNPFGLMRASDPVKNWEKLGLQREADFHLLAASYRTAAVYVVSEQPNSRMKSAGIYATLNQGFTWQRAQSNGLEGEIAALAVHPDDAKTVAVGTARGLFVSRDAGASFERVVTGPAVTGIAFDLDGKELWYGAQDRNGPLVARLDLAARRSTPLRIPVARGDTVTYIAQASAQPAQYAIATAGRDIYVTRDHGVSWAPIAQRGKPM